MEQKKLPLINSAHDSETRNIINELIKLFNGMGYTYDEALQKAHDVLDEAQKTNDMNKDLQREIDRTEKQGEQLEKMYTSDTFLIKYWELGEINYKGEELENNKIVRSGYINVMKGSIIDNLSEELKGVYIFRYDENKKLIGTTNYSNQYLSNMDGYIRIMTGFKNEKVIEDLSYFENKIKVTLNAFGGNSLYNTIFGREYYLNIWTLGSVSTSNGVEIPSENRVLSEMKKVKKGMKVILSKPEGIRGLTLIKYSDDKTYENYYIHESEHLIQSDGYIRIVTGYSDNRNIVNIDKFLNNIMLIGGEENSRNAQKLNVGEDPVNQWEMGSVAANGNEYFVANRIRTDYIKAPAGTTFYTEKSSDLKGIYLVQYDTDKNVVSQADYSDKQTTSIDGYVKLITGYSDDSDINDLNFIQDRVFAKQERSSINQYLSGDFNSYLNSEKEESLTVDDEFSLASSTIEDVYERYDALLSDNDSIIEKKLLGYGGDSLNTPDNSLPIYEYTIKSLKGMTSYQSGTPTILIVTGIHGDEKSTVWSTLRFAEQLLSGWPDKDNLESILSNVNLKIIPVGNPGGYNANTRINLHGVDINRNFSYRWDAFTTPNYNKGSAPYSEIETKLIRDWMRDNKNALAFIDYHNVLSRYTISYLDTPNKKLHKIYSSQIRRMTNRWLHKYGKIDEAEPGITQGYITVDLAPMSFQEGIVQGIENSTIIETARDYNGVEFNGVVIERGVEVIGNYILGLLDAYSKNYID